MSSTPTDHPTGDESPDDARLAADPPDTDRDDADWDGSEWGDDLDDPDDEPVREHAGTGATWDDADDDGTDWDGSDWGDPSAVPADPLAARNELRRLQRRRWRRRRRLIGTLVFLLVVGGLGWVVARAAGVGEDDQEVAGPTTTTAPTTSSTLPPAGPYRVLDGLNARSGPGSTFPVVGTVRVGTNVMVVCVADGDLVNGPNGQSTKWLAVLGPFGGTVFVTATYVAIGTDLNKPDKIAPCPK